MPAREITLNPGDTLTITVAGANSNTVSNISANIVEADIQEGGKRNSRKTRKASKGGAKKGPNGYMKFAAEVRPQILEEHPELKSDVVKVARKIGEKWRALSDSEKKRY